MPFVVQVNITNFTNKEIIKLLTFNNEIDIQWAPKGLQHVFYSFTRDVT